MNEQRIITEEELKYIDDFCKKWDVVYLDLRLELVDHIAERVSELITERPDLSFDEAFKLVYKSFGIYGLSDVVADHQKTMMKNYWGSVWKLFKPWFTPPRIILTAGVLYGLFHLFDAMKEWSLIGMIVPPAVFLYTVYYSVWTVRRAKRKLNGERTMLMWGVLSNLLWAGYFLFMLPTPYLKIINMDFDPANYSPLMLSIYTVLALLFANANFKILKMVEREVDQLSTKNTQLA